MKHAVCATHYTRLRLVPSLACNFVKQFIKSLSLSEFFGGLSFIYHLIWINTLWTAAESIILSSNPNHPQPIIILFSWYCVPEAKADFFLGQLFEGHSIKPFTGTFQRAPRQWPGAISIHACTSETFFFFFFFGVGENFF